MVGPPGVEPGSTASEAAILSIELWTQKKWRPEQSLGGGKPKPEEA